MGHHATWIHVATGVQLLDTGGYGSVTRFDLRRSPTSRLGSAPWGVGECISLLGGYVALAARILSICSCEAGLARGRRCSRRRRPPKYACQRCSRIAPGCVLGRFSVSHGMHGSTPHSPSWFNHMRVRRNAYPTASPLGRQVRRKTHTPVREGDPRVGSVYRVSP